MQRKLCCYVFTQSGETNYRPKCQTSGKILADRALSRILKEDWPGSLEELEDGNN